jgi:hypothetical protein
MAGRWSGLITRTLHVPVVAPVKSKTPVICVELITFTFSAMIGGSPSLSILTSAPGANVLPCKVTVIALFLVVPMLGMILKICGDGSVVALGVTTTISIGGIAVFSDLGVSDTQVAVVWRLSSAFRFLPPSSSAG